MAEFDLAALNALPKSGQALALAVVNGQLRPSAPNSALHGRWSICPASSYSRPVSAFRRRYVCTW